jgi:hypothetical protein
MRRRVLVFTAVLAAGLLFREQSLAQSRPAPAPASGPAWNSLSPQQREALAPLAGQWPTMTAERKRKWLDIAEKYPQLSPEGKTRLHSRMAEFARLTPQQKQTARENFQRAYELPLQSRESAVEQYKALPPEKKKELAERSKRRDGKAAEKKK